MCEMAESRRICGILPVWLQDLQEEGELLWRSGGVKVGMGVECSDQQEQGSERARFMELWIQDRKFHSTGVPQKDGSLSHTLVNPKVMCQMGSIRGVRTLPPLCTCSSHSLLMVAAALIF